MTRPYSTQQNLAVPSVRPPYVQHAHAALHSRSSYLAVLMNAKYQRQLMVMSSRKVAWKRDEAP